MHGLRFVDLEKLLQLMVFDCPLLELASATSRRLLLVPKDVICHRGANGERGSDGFGLAGNKSTMVSPSNC